MHKNSSYPRDRGFGYASNYSKSHFAVLRDIRISEKPGPGVSVLLVYGAYDAEGLETVITQDKAV
jgi:hypothetical protein